MFKYEKFLKEGYCEEQNGWYNFSNKKSSKICTLRMKILTATINWNTKVYVFFITIMDWYGTIFHINSAYGT